MSSTFRVKSLAVYEESEDKQSIARVLYEIGLVHDLPNPDQALEYFNRSLAVSEEIRGKSRTVMALNRLDLIYHSQARYELAVETYEKSRALGEDLNGKLPLERVLNNLGDLYLFHGFRVVRDMSRIL